ncbi:uncharacterized protein LOC120157303 [Hibiscus syriacus]|uniref:uncharacterized protein LOC120157303 n=1 Tax=Hibiscus syriacus TaxID=106335 RepID=UPI00192232F6|nr:uncharacterized protein LOC120157303 [Hibiscus syriacus]
MLVTKGIELMVPNGDQTALEDKDVANCYCYIQLGYLYMQVFSLVVDGLWCCDMTEVSRIAPGKDLRWLACILYTNCRRIQSPEVIPQTIPTALARNDPASSTIVLDPSMESGPVPDIEKAIISRPVTYVAPMSSILQIKPHFDEEPFTVSTLLNTLGLGKYAVHFMAEEVDMTALRQMGDRDLKELGIPMGPRKKLLLALRPYSRRHLPRIIRL